MVRSAVKFRNSNDLPIYVQVDPWAGVYTLGKGKEVEIITETENTSAVFHIEEHGRTRILTILDSTEYFVMRDGEPVHWTQYQSGEV